MLYFKEDWADAQPRLTAWWQGEVVDRVALAIRCPRDNPLPEPDVPPEPDDPFEWWTSVDYRVLKAERTFARTAYYGEAFPFFMPDLGPGSMALYLGCEPTLDKNTTWYNPILDSLEAPPRLAFDPENRWWRINRAMVEAGVGRGKGRYLTTHPDIIENLDVVASLRGTEPLLTDLIEHPASVHAALRQINDLYFVYFDALYDLIEPATPGGGCASLFSVWGPGKVAKVQCDFSAMISPRMFRDFVVPYLDEQCRRLDYSLYHLDGPQAVCHLDALLEIPSLNVIQWTPGAAWPDCGDPLWFDMYRKVLRAGKALLLHGCERQKVEPMVRELGPEGLFVGTTVDSEAEARAMLAAAKTW